MAINVYLTKAVIEWTLADSVLPVDITLFGTNVDDDTPVSASASGSDVNPTTDDLIDAIVTDNGWVLVN